MRLLRKYLLLTMWVVSFASMATQSRANGVSLAIFNFRAASIEALMYNSEILYTLLAALEREKGIKLMPRRQMEAILSQNNLAQSGHPEIVIKAGQVLSADFILFGSVAKKDNILAQLKLMDIANRRVARTWELQFSEPQTISERMPLLARQLTAAILSAKGPLPFGNSDVNTTNDKTISRPKPTKIEKVGERLPYPPLIMSSSGRVRETEIKFVPALQNMKANIAIVSYKIYRHDPSIDKWTLIQTVNARASSKIVFTIKDTHAMKDGATYRYTLTSIDKQGRESPRSDTITVQTAQSSQKDFKEHRTSNDAPSLDMEATQKDLKEHRTSNDAPALDIETVQEDLIEHPTSNIEHLASKDAPALDIETAQEDIVALLGTPVLGVARDDQLRQTDLVWRAMANAEGYHLYRKSQGTDWHKIATITIADQCHYTDTANLDDGQIYHYYLTAYNSAEETEPSEQVSAKTKVPPHCPQEISAFRQSNKRVKITWTPLNDPDVGGYVIYRGSIADKSLKSVSVQEIAQVKGWQADSYIDQEILSAEPDREYYYAIKGFNLFNARGVLSEAVRVKTDP